MGPTSVLFGALVLLSAMLAVRALGGKGAFSRIGRSLREQWPWLLLLIIATAAEGAFNRLPPHAPPFTIYRGNGLLEGVAPMLQGAFPDQVAIPLFATVYLAAYPALLIAIPLSLAALGRTLHLRTYCVALSLTYLALITLHFLILSPRPGVVPGSSIGSLLYSDPFWGQLSLDIGSRGNSFPSGHTSIVTAALVSLWSMGRTRAGLGAFLVLTIVGVLYLGLHWPLDVVGGLLLGSAAGLAARRLVGKWSGHSEAGPEDPDGKRSGL